MKCSMLAMLKLMALWPILETAGFKVMSLSNSSFEPCQGTLIADERVCGGGVVPDCNAKYVRVQKGGFAQCKVINGQCLTAAPCIDPVGKARWQLVMKVGTQTDKLGFSSALWTNDQLLNQNSPMQDSTDAKYAAYLNVPFKEIRMCIGSPESNCVTHKFSKSYDSAKALFSAGYIRDQTVKRDEILKAFGVTPGSYQDCPMQRPGFNIKCHDNNWARWGFCLNCASQGCQNSDNNDADASIGIGLRGQSTNPPEMGAGWTEYFASGKGTCIANSKTYKSVWIWVK